MPNRSRTDPRSNFFTNRVVRTWNSSPITVKESKSVHSFKRLLDELKLVGHLIMLGDASADHLDLIVMDELIMPPRTMHGNSHYVPNWNPGNSSSSNPT